MEWRNNRPQKPFMKMVLFFSKLDKMERFTVVFHVW